MLFLEEIPKWEPGGLHHSLLYKKMFKHVRVVRIKEYHRDIHWGHWQPSPNRSPQVEVSIMGLLTPQMIHKEILTLYQKEGLPNDTWGNLDLVPGGLPTQEGPGEVQCLDNAVEETCIKILEAPLASGGVPPSQRGKLKETPPGHLLRQKSMPRQGNLQLHWLPLWKTARVPGGGPVAGERLSLSGIGHSSHTWRTHRMAEPLHLPGVVWQLEQEAIRHLLAVRKQEAFQEPWPFQEPQKMPASQTPRNQTPLVGRLHTGDAARKWKQIPLAQYGPGGGQIPPAWHDPRGTQIPPSPVWPKQQDYLWR